MAWGWPQVGGTLCWRAATSPARANAEAARRHFRDPTGEEGPERDGVRLALRGCKPTEQSGTSRTGPPSRDRHQSPGSAAGVRCSPAATSGGDPDGLPWKIVEVERRFSRPCRRPCCGTSSAHVAFVRDDAGLCEEALLSPSQGQAEARLSPLSTCQRSRCRSPRRRSVVCVVRSEQRRHPRRRRPGSSAPAG
jgi:hypothetical protein